MKKPTFKIKIEEPCPVQKDRLSKVELGYYCSVCQKCVVDYSQYSAQQIARELNREPGKERCGIFTHAQLQKVYQAKPAKKYGIFSSLLFSGLLLANKNSHAQSEVIIDTMVTAQLDSVGTILPDTNSTAQADTILLEEDSIQPKDEVFVEFARQEICIDWTKFEGTHTVGFMVMEPVENRPIPFESIIDSTKSIFAGFLGFFSSPLPKPNAPKNQGKNNDRPLWMESFRHRFRRKKKK